MTYLSAQAFVDRTQDIDPNELIDLLDGAKVVLGALGKQYSLAPVRDAVAQDHSALASMIDLLIATRNATPKAINAIIHRVQQRA